MHFKSMQNICKHQNDMYIFSGSVNIFCRKSRTPRVVVKYFYLLCFNRIGKYEPGYEISNNVVCATSKTSDQPSHTRSLIRAFASRLYIL